MVFHCVSSLLQGSVVSFKMSLVPSGRSVVAWSLPSGHKWLTFCQSSKYTWPLSVPPEIFSFLFWHWYEGQLHQVLVFNWGLTVASVSCLGSRSKNWSERQGVCSKAYWKWNMKETLSREKPGLQPCSSRVQLPGVSLVLCRLSHAGGKNQGISASVLMSIWRQPDVI
jgi:hypothetical protein